MKKPNEEKKTEMSRKARKSRKWIWWKCRRENNGIEEMAMKKCRKKLMKKAENNENEEWRKWKRLWNEEEKENMSNNENSWRNRERRNEMKRENINENMKNEEERKWKKMKKISKMNLKKVCQRNVKRNNGWKKYERKRKCEMCRNENEKLSKRRKNIEACICEREMKKYDDLNRRRLAGLQAYGLHLENRLRKRKFYVQRSSGVQCARSASPGGCIGCGGLAGYEEEKHCGGPTSASLLTWKKTWSWLSEKKLCEMGIYSLKRLTVLEERSYSRREEREEEEGREEGALWPYLWWPGSYRERREAKPQCVEEKAEKQRNPCRQCLY